MLLWVGLVIFAFSASKIYMSMRTHKDNRDRKLKQIQKRLAEKEREAATSEQSVTPKPYRRRRR